jgi:hypothetical protein
MSDALAVPISKVMARRYRLASRWLNRLPAATTKPPLDQVGRGLALVLQRSWVLIINILPSGTLRITSERRRGKSGHDMRTGGECGSARTATRHRDRVPPGRMPMFAGGTAATIEHP